MAGSDPDIDELRPFEEYVALRPSDALFLGVEGNDEVAAAARLRIATALGQQHLQRINAAYSDTQWLRKPEVDAPFGLYLTIRSQGDVTAVLDDPDLRQHLANHLGFADREAFVRDHAGYRWEIDNQGRDLPENQQLIDHTLEQLQRDVTGSIQPHGLKGMIERIEAVTARIVQAANALGGDNTAGSEAPDFQVQADRTYPTLRL